MTNTEQTTRRIITVETDPPQGALPVPAWATALDGQPATDEQIEASDNAATRDGGAGIITVNSDGDVIRPGQFHRGGLAYIWVD